MPFDANAYGQQHPDLVNNYKSDPGYGQMYGPLERYLAADAASNGSDQEKQGAAQFLQGNAGPAEGGAAAPAASVFAKYPDLASAYTAALATNPNLTTHDFAIQYGNAHPDDTRFNDDAFLSSVGIAKAPAVPAEQFLGDTAIARGTADIAGDAGRQADAQKIVDSINGGYDAASKLNATLLPGANGAPSQRLTDENSMVDTTQNRINDAIKTQTATTGKALDDRIATSLGASGALTDAQKAALATQTGALTDASGKLDVSRLAALDPVTKARLDAANQRAAAINQAEQGSHDQIVAADAAKGYIGGSAANDAALLRSTLDARQGAAAQMGDARLSNASDIAKVNDDGAQRLFGITSNDANQGFNITNAGATRTYDTNNLGANDRFSLLASSALDTSNAAKAAAAAKSGYFDADLPRSMEAALRPAEIGKQQLSLIGVPEQIGYGGLTRAQNALNWFSATPSMPQSGTFNFAPSTAGSDIAGLGAGLVKGAFNSAGTDWSKIFAAPATPKSGAVIAPGTGGDV